MAEKKIVLREEVVDMLQREIQETLRKVHIDFSLAEIVKACYMFCRDNYERSDKNRQGKLMLRFFLMKLVSMTKETTESIKA